MADGRSVVFQQHTMPQKYCSCFKSVDLQHLQRTVRRYVQLNKNRVSLIPYQFGEQIC